jgi:hypothetical protein
MRVHPLYSNFVGGEVTPRLYGRADSDLYKTMMAHLKNCTVYPQGPFTRRPGFQYIAATKYSDKKAILVRFRFSETQMYMLEFGHEYIRVFYQGSQVLSGGSAYEIATPYDEDDLASLRFARSTDTLFIVHPDYEPRYLVRAATDDWTLSTLDAVWGPFLSENESVVTMTPSVTTGSGTLTASSSSFSVNSAGFNSGHIGSQWEIKGPLTKSASITAQDTWTDTITVKGGNTVGISLSGTWSATVSLQRSYDGGTTWLNYGSGYTANTLTEVYETSTQQNGVMYRLGVETGNFTSGTITAKLMDINYSGYATITAITSATVASITVDEELPSTAATERWAEGAWSDLRGYPSAIAFFKLRLIFAGTNSHPQTVWGSVIDDFNNFKYGVLDGDAWSYTLYSDEYNKIISMVPGSVLHIFTAGSEWRLGGTDENSAPTPTDVEAKQETFHGSENIQAIKVGSSVAFIQDGGEKLRRVIYNFKDNAWNAPDISKYSEHLFRNEISSLTYQAQPDPAVWMTRKDGALISCNVDFENSIYAYGQHWTGASEDAAFEWVEALDQEVWAIVERVIDGSVVKNVECMSPVGWVGAYTQNSSWSEVTTNYEVLAGEDDLFIHYILTNGWDDFTTLSFIGIYDDQDVQFGTYNGGGADYAEWGLIRFDEFSLTSLDYVTEIKITGYCKRTFDYSSTNETIRIYGIKALDPSPPSNQSEWEAMSYTTAYVDWTLNTSLTAGDAIETPDLSSIVSELIAQSGWVEDNAIMFVFDPQETVGGDNTNNLFDSYDYATYGAPQLAVKAWTASTVTAYSDDIDQSKAVFLDSAIIYNDSSNVINITQAEPPVVTCYQDYSNGDTIHISGVLGMTEIDGVYKIKNRTVSSFELTDTDDVDIDATGFTAYTGGGLVEKYATTITGLSHLEGETVGVWADGVNLANETVSSGQITIDTAAKYVVVGIPYLSVGGIMDPEVGTQDGTAQGRRQQQHGVTIRVMESLGFSMGYDEDNLETVPFRASPYDTEEMTSIYTGDIYGIYHPDPSTTVNRIFIGTNKASPLTVLAIMPTTSTNE